MNLAPVVLAGQLDPADEFNAPPDGFWSGHRQGGNRVVVGNCQRGQADSCRGDDDLARRANSVRMRRVNMQDRHDHAGAREMRARASPLRLRGFGFIRLWFEG